MHSQTKLGIWTLFIITGLVILARLSNLSLRLPEINLSRSFFFDFSSKNLKESEGLKKVVEESLAGKKGTFAVYIEELAATASAKPEKREKYSLLPDEPFPAASLYKLVLLAAVLKEVERGRISLGETLSGTKTHLSEVYGGVDFGYKDAPEGIGMSVKEALERVGRISDNFAAIMLADRLRQIPQPDGEEGLLVLMAKDLGMNQTDFMVDPIIITAADTGEFFRALYEDKVVSASASQQIKNLLALSQINDRIPAKLPEEIKVIHKTGELSHLRHDAGIVFLPEHPYIIVILTKDLEFEDEGIETLAKISKDVYEYFNRGDK